MATVDLYFCLRYWPGRVWNFGWALVPTRLTCGVAPESKVWLAKFSTVKRLGAEPDGNQRTEGVFRADSLLKRLLRPLNEVLVLAAWALLNRVQDSAPHTG